jgi:hypothetical protein
MSQKLISHSIKIKLIQKIIMIDLRFRKLSTMKGELQIILRKSRIERLKISIVSLIRIIRQ